eukprot:466198-Prorocentrum_minimum.AAC.10
MNDDPDDALKLALARSEAGMIPPLIETLESVLYDTLKKYDTNKHELEIELRLGWLGVSNANVNANARASSSSITRTHFDTNIGERYYTSFASLLNHSVFANTRVESLTDVYVHGCHRTIVDGQTGEALESHVKRRLATHDFELRGTPFDLRISACSESQSPTKSVPRNFGRFVRRRYRQSFWYKHWRYDLSVINSADHTQTYEFELELIPSSIQSLDIVPYCAHSSILKIFDLIHSDPEKSYVTEIYQKS